MLFCFSHRRQSASAVVTAGIAVIFWMMATSNNNNNVVVVEAYPNGAGSCVTDGTAGFGPHVNKLTSETFTSRGYEIVLTSSSADGVAELVATAFPNVNSIDAGVSYKVSVRNNRLTFRGAAIVLDGNDDSEIVPTSDDATVKDLALCTSEGLLGITHTDRSDKSSLSGEMKVSAGNATLHVSVVEVNDSTNNVCFYEKVALAVAAAAPSSSSAPVVPAPPTTMTAPMATSPTMTAPMKSPRAPHVAPPVTAPTSSNGNPIAPTPTAASAGALTCGGWTTTAAAAVVAMVGSTSLLVTMMH